MLQTIRIWRQVRRARCVSLMWWVETSGPQQKKGRTRVDKISDKTSGTLFPLLSTSSGQALTMFYVLFHCGPLRTYLCQAAGWQLLKNSYSTSASVFCCLYSLPSWIHQIFHFPFGREAICPLSDFSKTRNHVENLWPRYFRAHQDLICYLNYKQI